MNEFRFPDSMPILSVKFLCRTERVLAPKLFLWLSEFNYDKKLGRARRALDPVSRSRDPGQIPLPIPRSAISWRATFELDTP